MDAKSSKEFVYSELTHINVPKTIPSANFVPVHGRTTWIYTFHVATAYATKKVHGCGDDQKVSGVCQNLCCAERSQMRRLTKEANKTSACR